MRSPFVKVYIKSSNRDITEFVESFDYENCIEKDNLINLKIKSNYAFEFADDDDIIAGKEITCQFGFLGQVISPVHLAKITDIEVNYGERITMAIKCLDRGQDMKKGTSTKIWKGKKASEIAKDIADKYALDYVGTDTDRVYPSLPQGNKTDFEFLQDLAGKEKNGNFIFYIADNELHFDKVDYKKDAKLTYTYGTDIISFSPKFKESNQKGGGKSAKVKGFDPMNKKPLNSETTPTTAIDSQKLAEFDVNGGAKFDINSLKQGSGGAANGVSLDKLSSGGLSSQSLGEGSFNFKGLGQATSNASEKTTGKGGYGNINYLEGTQEWTMPLQDPQELSDVSNKIQKTGGMPSGGAGRGGGAKILTATLKIEGNPLIKAGDIITIAGVAKKHLGNWFVEKIKHGISNGAYISDLEMRKNGTSKPVTKGAAKTDSKEVNKSIGAKTEETKKIVPEKIVHWNNDGGNKRIING